MKKKIVFSLVVSLVLLVAVSAPLLFTGAPSSVLAQEDHGGNGGDDGGDHGGNGGNGDSGGHGDKSVPHSDDDSSGFDPAVVHELIQQNSYNSEEIDALWQMEPPEGQEYGVVQNMRDPNGDIVMTESGVPVLGRQVFDSNTGEPVFKYTPRPEALGGGYYGEPIYIANWGELDIPTTGWWRDLSPGYRSGPGYERFAYTPPPGMLGDYQTQWDDYQTQDTPPPYAPPPVYYQTQDTPPPVADDQTQTPPPPVPIPPEPENQEGEPSPAQASDDGGQFGEPQPVMGPTGNPRVDEDGAPILGRVVLDEEGNPVIGPNGKPIIVTPD